MTTDEPKPAWDALPLRFASFRMDMQPSTGLGSRCIPSIPPISRAGRPTAGADFFFDPGYNTAIAPFCGFAFTVHDRNNISVPEDGSFLKQQYCSRILRLTVHGAAAVLHFVIACMNLPLFEISPRRGIFPVFFFPVSMRKFSKPAHAPTEALFGSLDAPV